MAFRRCRRRRENCLNETRYERTGRVKRKGELNGRTKIGNCYKSAISVKIETHDLRSWTKVGLFQRRVDASGELGDAKNIGGVRI